MITIIRHAHILTMGGPEIPDGCLLMADGLVAAAAAGEPPANWLAAGPVEQVDAAGGWLLPGLIDAHCHLGLFDDGLALEGDDGNESSDPVTPQLRAIDGIYQEDRCFTEALAAGVTGVMTGPGSANVLAGHFAFLHTAGCRVDTMAVEPLAAMKAALGENPKKIHGRQNRSPMTRMATAALLREALLQASQYRDRLAHCQAETAAGRSASPPDIDMRWEALLAVLRGRLPVKFHAHRSDDILTAIRIANEFGLRYTLDHCTEGYRIADLLAAEFRQGQADGYGCGQPGRGRLEGIIVGPLIADRGKPELRQADRSNPAVLARAGLPVAIMTDHPEVPIQYLAVSAALAVRAGLPEDQALAAITLTAARLSGVSDRLGSLEPGKQADCVLFSGHPFDFRSRTRRVWIKGQTVWQEGSPHE